MERLAASFEDRVMQIKAGEIYPCVIDGKQTSLRTDSSLDGGNLWICTYGDLAEEQTAVMLSVTELQEIVTLDAPIAMQ